MISIPEQTFIVPYALLIESEEKTKRRDQIKQWLDEGKTVVFKLKGTNIVKTIREWKEDKDGDLLADTWTGKVPSICWESNQYEVSWEE